MTAPSPQRSENPGMYRFAVYGAALSGMATLLLGIIMLFVFPASAELSAGFRTPIVAFEFARSDADLAFLSGSSEVAISNRDSMDAGHRWDSVFPFAYAGFVALLMMQLVALGVSIAALSLGLFLHSAYALALIAALTAFAFAVCWVTDALPLAAEIMAAASSVFFLVFTVRAVAQARIHVQAGA